jgi:hypothetical protein
LTHQDVNTHSFLKGYQQLRKEQRFFWCAIDLEHQIELRVSLTSNAIKFHMLKHLSICKFGFLKFLQLVKILKIQIYRPKWHILLSLLSHFKSVCSQMRNSVYLQIKTTQFELFSFWFGSLFIVRYFQECTLIRGGIILFIHNLVRLLFFNRLLWFYCLKITLK